MCRETCWVRDASGVTSVPQCAFLCLDVGAAFVWSQRQWLVNNKKYQEGADEEKRHNLLNNNARIQCTRALWFSHFRDWQPTEQHFTCYKNIANLSKDREKVCRSYPGTWSRQIFKPLASQNHPSPATAVSSITAIYMKMETVKATVRKMKFDWSLVHWQWPETDAAYCSQLDGKNMWRLESSAILSMDKKIVFSRKMLKITVIDVLSI